MAVGKSSIQRVKVATGSSVEEVVKVTPAETEVKKVAPKKTEVKKEAPKKEAEKKPVAKKTAAKKPVAKKATAPKKDDIHEKKFEMIDGIYSTLPTYLL